MYQTCAVQVADFHAHDEDVAHFCCLPGHLVQPYLTPSTTSVLRDNIGVQVWAL